MEWKRLRSLLLRHHITKTLEYEKTQDFTILFLFSIGMTKGKWGTLLTTLIKFKEVQSVPLRPPPSRGGTERRLLTSPARSCSEG